MLRSTETLLTHDQCATTRFPLAKDGLISLAPGSYELMPRLGR